MTQQRHADLHPGNIHGLIQWNRATTVLRDAIAVTVDDVGKVCRVGDTMYWLAAVSPAVSWLELGTGGVTNIDGGSAASIAPITENLDGGGA